MVQTHGTAGMGVQGQRSGCDKDIHHLQKEEKNKEEELVKWKALGKYKFWIPDKGKPPSGSQPSVFWNIYGIICSKDSGYANLNIEFIWCVPSVKILPAGIHSLSQSAFVGIHSLSQSADIQEHNTTHTRRGKNNNNNKNLSDTDDLTFNMQNVQINEGNGGGARTTGRFDTEVTCLLLWLLWS